jgi:hypothetical protein
MRTTLYISLFLFSVLSIEAAAQKNGREGDPSNCYSKYMKGFEKRGAKKVGDGVHKNVVITVRKGNSADCYLGKAKVKSGTVTQAYRMVTDSTYEELSYDYKHDEVEFEIVNGVAGPKVTDDEEMLVNVLFVQHIKPKQKDYIRAPSPDFD